MFSVMYYNYGLLSAINLMMMIIAFDRSKNCYIWLLIRLTPDGGAPLGRSP